MIVSPERLAPLVLKRTDPRNRSEQEVAGYRDALGLIHESASEMRLTANVILQLHGMLYRYLPDPGGRWKSTPNDIVERHPDGTERIRFKPTPPHLVQIQIDGLCKNYAGAQTQAGNPWCWYPSPSSISCAYTRFATATAVSAGC